MPTGLRSVTADNGNQFTLDGTRTYLVGERSVALIDPGPDSDAHVAALSEAVGGAEEVRVVLTHGHRDHAEGAAALAGRLGAEIWGPEALEPVTRPVGPGEAIPTDHGDLIAIDTPGHARPHFALHWPARRALFVGDLLLGRGDTTWVGEYPGCVADYMASLDTVGGLDLAVMYPAHGPDITEPADAVRRFRRHRLERIRQVEEALAAEPGATDVQLLRMVYGGDLGETVGEAVVRSIAALREHVEGRAG